MGKAAFTEDGFNKRMKKCMDIRKKILKRNLDSIHVRVMQGNSKTGVDCWTVSLMPVIDCINCKGCRLNCYDLKSCMRFPVVIEPRAINSVIHQNDPKRYWKEIDEEIKKNNIKQLRINVGGDLKYNDFIEVAKLGRKNKDTLLLFFTKNYDGINEYLATHRFPKNVHPIMSKWEGMKMYNPNKLPESHLLYDDGRTTAPEYGAVYCGGNCSECAMKGKGCWTLKKGEHVIFHAH